MTSNSKSLHRLSDGFCGLLTSQPTQGVTALRTNETLTPTQVQSFYRAI